MLLCQLNIHLLCCRIEEPEAPRCRLKDEGLALGFRVAAPGRGKSSVRSRRPRRWWGRSRPAARYGHGQPGRAGGCHRRRLVRHVHRAPRRDCQTAVAKRSPAAAAAAVTVPPPAVSPLELLSVPRDGGGCHSPVHCTAGAALPALYQCSPSQVNSRDCESQVLTGIGGGGRAHSPGSISGSRSSRPI